jgi:3-phenylpropionate/cinnamic acid dioxygenase small subunit
MSNIATAGTGSPLYWSACQFLYREAALLDGQDWDGWGRLFTPEGLYWVPATRGQKDPVNHVSLVYENALLREIRLARLKQAEASSLAGGPNSSHLISNILLASADEAAGCCTLHSRFVVAQFASWGTTTFQGAYTHELVCDAVGKFRISLKRVDLVDVDGPLGDILVIL